MTMSAATPVEMSRQQGNIQLLTAGPTGLKAGLLNVVSHAVRLVAAVAAQLERHGAPGGPEGQPATQE